jgi:hypothetical protein
VIGFLNGLFFATQYCALSSVFTLAKMVLDYREMSDKDGRKCSALVLDANNVPTPAPPVYGWFLFNAMQFLATKMR